MKFDKENRSLTLDGDWSTSANRHNEFDIPRARIPDVALLQIRDFLKEAHEELEGGVSSPAAAILVAPPLDGIRVYGGDGAVRYEILELNGDDHLSLTLSVDYSRVQTAKGIEDRLADYFTRRGVELLGVRFCGPAESVEMCIAVPLDWSAMQCAAFSDALAMLLQRDRVNFTTPAGVYALVSAGFPTLVLGEGESEWLEVKRENYGIGVDSQKYEFACDVASFANSDSGGLLIIGIASEKDSSGNDVLARMVPCRRGSIHPQRYMQILRDRVVPPVEGLRIDVVPVDSGDVMVVYIPPQPEEIKPFIVKGAMIGSKVSGSFFSIPHRRGSDKWAMSPEAVHSMLVAARTVLRGRGAVDPSEV
ncbi:Putative DNA-binding domain-containing protein [Streptomyces sp. Termitarium-T10T-6]|nr:ATP-binding protein [Streptomyces sp. Termitarium-T10T-6]SCD41138.1 Putative DNA-binding domain-containing protein [Streptomyces sp. Termitarium-T10T-6]